ncbi:MAG: RNA pseudouridine synthase [Bacilli bacterium]
MEDGKKMNNVLYEDNHIIVVVKKPNVPVCEDESKDKDLLTITKEYIKTKYNKPGNVFLGLVHRLDRPVGGIMVFARTSKAASRLSNQIREDKFNKIYHAVVVGKVNTKEEYKDFLLKDPKTNISVVDPNGKLSILNYELMSYKNEMSLVKVYLKTGRSHQIRVQFSSHNHPLYGDQKYNKNTPKDNIALFASSLSFYHPITNELLEFKQELPNKYPFNIF